ncbi:MAG: GntR family transcriptional regulator [Bacteroidota bacterium]
MSVVFDYINLVQHQKSKTHGIVTGITDAIMDNAIAKGDSLPSVNRFIQKLGVARMTVVKALNILKERGVIVAEDKVGYFVRDVDLERELKVFLILSGFHSYHETIYNQIIEGIEGHNITVDLFFHHRNPKIFNSIIRENLGLYGMYIISVFDDPKVKSTLVQIPKRKLLQVIRPPILSGTSSICQDFYHDLKQALNKLAPKLEKYDEFVLVFPTVQRHPKIKKRAFIEFCEENNIAYSIAEKITKNLIVPGKAYGVIEDSDLLSVIEYCEAEGHKIGREIGLISYNETPMKRIIRDGITVVSANFFDMGQAIATYILNPEPTVQVFAPNLIIRNSI